ncbi:MAG: ABC transporter ATP-binding protein [Actinomycetia bacterium]|nr:ABC transporter ATP-binding protein [Actinomycetes bacterium]
MTTHLHSGAGATTNDKAGPSRRRVVDLEGVTKVYETGVGGFSALSDADLAIDAGEFVAIVGKSGSGKSTLLNMLTGIDRPTSGVVQVNGTVLDDLSENEVARWRGENVGLVFQFQQLMPTLTIIENVMMPMDFTKSVPMKDRRPRALDLLELVAIADQADKFPSALSGGQQQRAAIARSLANDPPLIAADEPTGNLDSHTADSVLGLLGDLTAAGKTVVMVTHERDIAARVDRVVTVADGRILGGDSLGAAGEGAKRPAAGAGESRE